MDIHIDRTDATEIVAVPQDSNPGVSIDIQQPARPQPVRPQPVRPQQLARPRPPLARPPPQQFTASPLEARESFAEFANPRKLQRPRSERSEVESEEDEDDESQQDYEYEDPLDEPPPAEDVPSEGFKTFDEEKIDILAKLHRVKKAGMPNLRMFSMASDIREMRSELSRVRAEMDLDASVKFQRTALLGVVSALEHVNRRFDPFDLQLNGWSDQMHDNINSYDRVFERLHEKYKSKVGIAPELELLLMVAGSAMMFHFSNTLFKQALPGMSADPGLVAGLMNSMMGGGGGKQPPQPPPPPPPREPQEPGMRREMRAPAFDLGGLGGALPFPPMAPPRMANPPLKRPAPAPEPEADRLSDIVSEDLNSIPDDMTGVADSEIGVKQVRGKKSKVTKNVIKLV